MHSSERPRNERRNLGYCQQGESRIAAPYTTTKSQPRGQSSVPAQRKRVAIHAVMHVTATSSLIALTAEGRSVSPVGCGVNTSGIGESSQEACLSESIHRGVQ